MRLFRFRVRTLLIVVLAVSIPLGLEVDRRRRAFYRQQARQYRELRAISRFCCVMDPLQQHDHMRKLDCYAEHERDCERLSLLPWETSRADLNRRRIRKALEQTTLDAQPATLEDAVRTVKASTISPDSPEGIYVYADPESLSFAGQTMDSRAGSVPEGLTLDVALDRMLFPLELGFEISGDELVISGRKRVERPRGAGRALW
jgi:hypothetical protein